MEATTLLAIGLAVLFIAVFALYFMILSFRSYFYKRLNNIGSYHAEIRERQDYVRQVA